ncbi:MAG: metalloregulator ArsR/SmtB family transcription factor [Minwuiales bacterium]|nr:metalloregulator ArsR/SmtB family transcription factor [Minwuiales bacterium]
MRHAFIDKLRYMNDQDIFSALSNPTRRKILAWMRDISGALGERAGAESNEVCVSEIQRKTNLSQSTVSAYMAALERAGLVTAERRGQWTFFKRDERAISAFARKIAEEL